MQAVRTAFLMPEARMCAYDGETMAGHQFSLSRRLRFVFAPAIALALLPSAATAAECVNNASVTTRQAVAFSSLIFEGKVVEIQDPNAPALTQVLTFEVDKVWKGPVTRRQIIYHVRTVEGRVFNEGDHLVVFAHQLSEQDRALVGLPSAGPAAFGWSSFNCVTDMPVDIDSELPRMPFSKPR
jgi:hypothetical protein